MRNYVSSRIAHINRRFIKKAAFADPTDDVPGYKTMAELCKDLDGLINIIWLSGTRTSPSRFRNVSFLTTPQLVCRSLTS